ncbi:MAG: rod shape-determining protein MreD [Candidatus Rokubacteria bacterium]|nr:rod shape-determining protein MreD [Candidatus Rokubacteria bacterium]
MKSLFALTVFGGGVAHLTLAPALRVADVAPDIPLLVVLLLALRHGPEFGGLAGFAAGLLQDAVSGGLVGVQALTKGVVGFGIGTLGGRFSVTQPLVQVPGLVLLSIVEGLGRFVILKLFHYPAAFGEVMTYVVLPQALYNGFLGAALVFALAWAESLRARTS